MDFDVGEGCARANVMGEYADVSVGKGESPAKTCETSAGKQRTQTWALDRSTIDIDGYVQWQRSSRWYTSNDGTQ